MPARKTIEDCRKLATSKGGKCLSKVYPNNKASLKWSCGSGHVWFASYNNVSARNSWCPECAGNVKKDVESCHALARRRGGRFLSKKYVNAQHKYLWMCKEGHVWKSKYCDVNFGYWCLRCSGKSKKTKEDYCALAKSKGGDWLGPLPCKTIRKTKWSCSLGHSWKATYGDVNAGTWCPLCAQTTAAKNQNRSFTLEHWKTGAEIVCVGSYEKAVVEYLNKHKIDFVWQPQGFETPIKTKTGKGSKYYPDLYLINEGRWIEIKGYFRKDAKEKWDWFHKAHPNSELWNKKKLVELGVF